MFFKIIFISKTESSIQTGLCTCYTQDSVKCESRTPIECKLSLEPPSDWSRVHVYLWAGRRFYKHVCLTNEYVFI